MKERLVYGVVMDEDLQRVIEFMDKNVSPGKRLHIADSLPHAGRLVWTMPHHQKEPRFYPLAVKHTLQSIGAV